MGNQWIVFEGLDGAGTTTQAKMLCDYFESKGIPFFATHEPTEGGLGSLCREYLKGSNFMNDEILTLLFNADRIDHLHSPSGILENIRKGNWIIQDRYFYSTMAYQDVSKMEWVDKFNEELPKPDFIFYLRVEVDECLGRIEDRGKTKECFENARCLKKSFDRYEKMFSDKFKPVIIDGAMSREEIHDQVIKTLTPNILSYLSGKRLDF